MTPMVAATAEVWPDELTGTPAGGAPRRRPSPDASDAELAALSSYDAEAFGMLYDRYADQVFRMVYHRLGDRADAEDVTAEVFHEALANIKKFEWRGAPFSAWLYRIASNAIADRWQRTQREQASTEADDPPDQRDSISPEEIEKRARLFRLVAGLPTDQRTVIEMRFAAGKSIAEIARELGRTDGAVKQLQFRAIRALRSQWQPKIRKKRIRTNTGRTNG
jgi:RNA polymerase sigma-70 factor (ECF subfamily)